MTINLLSRKLAYTQSRVPCCFTIKVSRGIRLHPVINQHRHYARKRPTPTFSAGTAAPNNDKTSQERAEALVKERATRPRHLLTPGRLILISVLGYLGYRLYTWQTNPRRSLTLNPKFFTPFILSSKEPVSTTSSVFNLLSVPIGQNTDNISEAWRLGVWSVQVMQPDLQIARSYTPLPPTEEMPDEQVRLFVRREVQGEVSGFLHRISPGTLVHLRGPHLEYRIPDNVEEVLFLAGGTGIAPALQVAYTLFTARPRSGREVPRIRILWANRRREDSRAGLEPPEVQQFRINLTNRIRNATAGGARGTPVITKPLDEAYGLVGCVKQTRLVEEVEQLATKSAGRVSVEYFVDEEGSFITEAMLESYLISQSSSDAPPPDIPSPRKKLLFVAGPDGFVSYFAGPKCWKGGRELQGPLGGILQKIDPQGWEIWTL
ncbi:MAG: hypothetical protein Q9217_006346 [Psora testacea]